MKESKPSTHSNDTGFADPHTSVTALLHSSHNIIVEQAPDIFITGIGQTIEGKKENEQKLDLMRHIVD